MKALEQVAFDGLDSESAKIKMYKQRFVSAEAEAETIEYTIERRMEVIPELREFINQNPSELARLNGIYSKLASSKKMLNWHYISTLDFMQAHD